MKKILFIVALAAISFQSCASGDNNTKNESAEGTMVSESKSDRLITKEQFIKTVWNFEESPNEWKFLGNKPVIIDFYADWCGPCKTASPILEKVAEEYAEKIDVYKIDTEAERELASVFGISSIPAFLYIPMEGKPVMTAGIARSNDETKNMFIANIKKYLLTAE